MRPWRCAPSTGISCAASGRSSFRWCTSADGRRSPPHDAPHPAPGPVCGGRLPGHACPGAVVRDVRERPGRRPARPRLQLERPLPHGGAIHDRRAGRSMAFLPVPAPTRSPRGGDHPPGPDRAAPPTGAGRGQRRRCVVSQAAVVEHHLGVEPAESPLTPESWGKLGMWIFLAADAMSFGGLLAGYGALRYGDPTWPIPSHILGIQLTAFMTFLLICSSVTMVEALAGIRHGDRTRLVRFLLLTITGGMMF